MYLVDTNVISELSRKKPDSGVAQFLASYTELQMSVITLHELEYGRSIIVPEQRGRIDAFIAIIKERFGASFIYVDKTIAEQGGRIRAARSNQGNPIDMADSLIVATALVHKLTLVTRNTKDFVKIDVKLLNPFNRQL
jgi:toxin FitB